MLSRMSLRYVRVVGCLLWLVAGGCGVEDGKVGQRQQALFTHWNVPYLSQRSYPVIGGWACGTCQ